VQAPFLSGGAEWHAINLRTACLEAGHEAEIITHPFRFAPPEQIRRCMQIWESEDFSQLSGYTPDVTICLRFPAYAVKAPRKVLWLLHQHRAAYDMWNVGPDADSSPDATRLRDEIRAFDSRHIGGFTRRFANSANVARRLREFCHLESKPLYHPPRLSDGFYTLPAEPFIFFPSRIEALKRQTLLIEAMRHVRSPVFALIGGTGGQQGTCEQLIVQHGLQSRVRLLGPLSDEELRAYYAASLAVFFAPRDEDYGYITLEAMLSSKPVITCTDSGGPLEFVLDGETGFVVDPEPRAVADAIDRLAADGEASRKMGERGRARYSEMGISWQSVVDTLLAS
jgi:glycosyltransferase involved in cell wall biosynthesis